MTQLLTDTFFELRKRWDQGKQGIMEDKKAYNKTERKVGRSYILWGQWKQEGKKRQKKKLKRQGIA